MATPQEIYDAIQTINNRQSFVQRLLADTLGWPIPDGIDDLGDIAFEWSAEELRADGLDKHLTDGRIYQFQKFHDDQPWGVFLLEFRNDDVFVKNRGLTGPLRKVLRGLVHNRRKNANLPSWNRENLLFICTDSRYRHYRFAYFKAPQDTEKTAPLALFGWNCGDTDIRTLCTHNLPYLHWDTDNPDYSKWRQAFDKQRLTEKFFNEYKAVFDIFQKDLARQTQKPIWAHDYALQFLNRCMFLYFIQQKKWLGGDCEFMKNFWLAYQQSGQPADTFFENWLKVLFFEAFNNRYNVRRPYMPDKIHTILLTAPYLNGGLFRENELDNPEFDFAVSDARFRQILELLDRYNFTVSESTPLDIEVAVDAEMLGMVYETLVNIAEDEDRRGDAGIFYTPRVEVDMMCRLSVVNYLSHRLGSRHRELFYKWLLAFSTDKQRIAEKGIVENQLLEPLRSALENLTVVDPACGSGAFLVGMLMVLDDLFDRLDKLEGNSRTAYDRRKDIIGRSLYGVDIKDWACHVAELRLWLALVIDADFNLAELHARREPLLPNFTFNIRCGDSLVQEVGGLDIAHRKGLSELSAPMKRKLTELKNEKIKFYNNDPDARFKTVEMLKQQELLIFRQLLEDRIAQLDSNAKELMRIQAAKKAPTGRQRNLLTGEWDAPSKQLTLDIEQRQQQIIALMDEKQRLEQLTRTLHNQANIPFVWDISFAEIFQSDRQGFDIVIGNPPYVRHEKIADPRLRPDQITADNKKQYKAKLQRLVYRAWHKWFDYKEAAGKATRTLDAKSDLYIYFFFYGLSLLNDKGTFCFITSNSWLDVGYGADLQEFLLNCCPVRMIIDNKAMRSFKSADVNTAIALFDAPSPRPNAEVLSNIARFVMFYVPFEQALDDVVFTLIEAVEHRTKTEKFRVFPVRQEILLADGCGVADDEDAEPTPKTRTPLLKTEKKYLGNKWGGKYLRAPDIYWTILEKGKGFLQVLSSYFSGECYLNTGGADGFYILTSVKEETQNTFFVQNSNAKKEVFEGEIEKEFLVPLVKDFTKYNKKIVIAGFDAYCFVPKGNLSSNAKRYIKWGEQQGYNNASATKNQNPWYKPTKQMLSSARFLVPRSFNDSFIIYHNPNNFMSLRFYRLHLKTEGEKQFVAYLNSTLLALFLSCLGNVALGQGVLDFFMADFLTMRIPLVLCKELEAAYDVIKDKTILPVWEEFGFKRSVICPLEHRRAIDDIVFDALKLTQSEREAVYEAVIDMVEARLKKADSLSR